MFYFIKNFSIKNLMVSVALAIFLILTLWWLFLNPFSNIDSLVHSKYIWGSFYQLIAIWGGVCGLLISRSLGGFRSFLGKSITLFSLGLLFQSLGQSVYSYYNLFSGVQAPYPSFGDIGYFGSVILYIFGVLYLIRVSGFKPSTNSLINKVQAIVIPLLMLVFSYHIFLQKYEFDWADKLKVFLDFGYPLGQAFYVSIALLVLFLSRKSLGGVLRKPVLLLVFALVVQYICDSNFLYHANAGTWYVGSLGDYLYAISYFIMTLAIIYMGITFQKIRSENSTASAVHPESNTSNDKLFNQILTEIIKRQARVGGNLAWEQARKVSGITIKNEATVDVTITGDPKEVIDELVYSYQNLFGDIAIEVSKNAVYYLIAELPKDQVPVSLK
ncbi:MAG: hypothetical protein AAB510_03500 [Patescibacteria group bacterium]